MPLRLILGGTFDPIHLGHLQMAETLYKEIEPEEFYFLPNYLPPHRAAPLAQPKQRVNMLKAALNTNSHFKIDTVECDKKNTSYTVSTLQALKKTLGSKVHLGLILGTDAFLKLDSWHHPEKLSALCHIILVSRQGTKNNQAEVTSLVETYFGPNSLTESASALKEQSSGLVFKSKITPPEISATDIRAKLKNGECVKHLVPAEVLDIIVSQGLYLA